MSPKGTRESEEAPACEDPLLEAYAQVVQEGALLVENLQQELDKLRFEAYLLGILAISGWALALLSVWR